MARRKSLKPGDRVSLTGVVRVDTMSFPTGEIRTMHRIALTAPPEMVAKEKHVVQRSMHRSVHCESSERRENSARGQRGAGNIRIHDRKRQRYRYTRCKQTFSARRETMLEGLRKPMELVMIVVTLVSYGCPIQAIVQAFGLDERTVASWRDLAGKHCQ